METYNCDDANKIGDSRDKWFIDRYHLATSTSIRSLENK
jgi:hypothetical protein